MGGPPPSVTQVDLLRKMQKGIDELGRRPNPLPRIAALEQRSHENRIINGNFRTNQRNALPDGAVQGYCFDRWKGMGQLNRARNPSGAVDMSGWTTSGTLSRLTGLVIPGLGGVTTALRNTSVAATTHGLYYPDSSFPIDVVAGRTYTVSAYVRASVAKSVTMSIQWMNSAGTIVSSSASSVVALAANTWTRISVTAVAPSGASIGQPFSYSTVAWAIGNTYDLTGLLFEESATLNAYIEPILLQFTAAPQGQPITIGVGQSIAQIVERTNAEAGAFVLSWEGTATARVYNVGAVAPAYQSSPVVVTLDGLADVTVELTGGTIGKVQLEAGEIATAYQFISVGEELLLCQRYYWRVSQPTGAPSAAMLPTTLVWFTTTIAYGPIPFPTTMRAVPTMLVSGNPAIAAFVAAAAPPSTSVTFQDTTRTTARMAVGTGATTVNLPGWAELNPGYWIAGDAEL